MPTGLVPSEGSEGESDPLASFWKPEAFLGLWIDGCLLPVSLQVLYARLYVQISSFYKDTSPAGLGPTQTASF